MINFDFLTSWRCGSSLGFLRNYDGNGNENVTFSRCVNLPRTSKKYNKILSARAEPLLLFTVAQFQLARVQFKRSRGFYCVFVVFFFNWSNPPIFLCHPNLHEEFKKRQNLEDHSRNSLQRRLT